VLLARPLRFAIPPIVRDTPRSARTNPQPPHAFQCRMRRKQEPLGHRAETSARKHPLGKYCTRR